MGVPDRARSTCLRHSAGVDAGTSRWQVAGRDGSRSAGKPGDSAAFIAALSDSLEHLGVVFGDVADVLDGCFSDTNFVADYP